MKLGLRLLVVCLALMLTLGTVSALSEGEQVVLKYTMWDVSLKEMEEETIIKPFEEANPNIKIDFQPMVWDEYWKRIQTSIAADDPYDVFYMSTAAYMQEFAHKGMLMNLQPYFDEGEELSTLSEFYTDILGSCRYEGDLYAFPYAWIGSVLYYNKDIFDEAGLEYPTDNWSYDDMWEAAKLLVSGEGPGKKYGFQMRTDHEFLDAYVNAAGGHVLSEDLKKCLVNEEVAVEAIQELYDKIYVDELSPTPASLQGQPDPFLSGKVAMKIGGSYSIDTYRTITDFDWDIAMVPFNAQTGERVIYGGPDTMCIASNCKNPDAAMKFLMYYCADGRDVSSYMGGKVPISRVIAEEDAWLEKGLKPENKIAILNSAPYIKDADFSYKWSEWRSSIMNNELDDAFNGNIEIQEACDTIVQEVDKILMEIQ